MAAGIRVGEELYKFAVELVAKHGNVSAAAKAAKVPRNTFDTWFRHALVAGHKDPRKIREEQAIEEALGVEPAPPPPPVVKEPPAPEERREIIALRGKVQHLERALREADHKAIEGDRFRKLSQELHENPMDPPAWTFRVPAGDDSPGVPILDLSDWHIGETVDPRQMHMANEFNEAIAERRVKAVFDRALYLCFHHVKTPRYPGIVVILGGDFVSGWLHEELFRTDWCAPTVAANWCVSRLHKGLARLADAFGQVWVVGVPGNHGRLTKKPMAKGGAEACFDHAIYEALADRLQDDARISFHIPPAGDCIIQVQRTRYLIMHGHELGVKGGDGIIGVLGPIIRGETKTARSERSVGRDYDVMVLHHYHTSIWMPQQRVIVNGTLKGYDEYARKNRYGSGPPTQWLWFSHPRFGPNMPFNLHLDDPPDAPVVAFAELRGG